MLMRHLLTIISHGLMTEKCLIAYTSSWWRIATYQTIWLTTIHWIWKILKNNKMQMMLCCNKQLCIWIAIHAIGTVDDILCYIKPGDPPNNWKKALTKNLLQPTTQWFHQVTGHPGSNRLFMQIFSWHYHRDICSLVDKFYCEQCQRNKLSGKGYGLLSECKLCSVPFEECAVDLIGPWVIQVCNKP